MKKTLVSLATIVNSFLLAATPVFAAACSGPLRAFEGQGCVCQDGGVPSLGCLAPIIANIIDVAMMLLGAVTLVLLLYGSIRYIISRGDAKALESAKKTITYAIIGAVLVLVSFIVINIIFVNLLGLPSPLANFTFVQ